MPVLMRIVELASGYPSHFDGGFVKEWDVNYIPEDTGVFDGGKLVVTFDQAEAKQYADFTEAAEAWKAQAPHPWETRIDGRPNRPLTAFSVEFVTIK